ncbi:MAG: GNAT family N-acetyltransferase [Dehalococcoidia bacterium]|nr:GNAT family N-acetyltransferase [Dehalococcoidia bacterium]
MRIRRALPSDAPGIAHVHVESWRSTYVGIVPDDYLTSLDRSERERVWRRLIADETQITYLVENSRDGIVGFVNGGPARMDDKTYAGELYAIYLLEQYQRQGIGRRLVGELCAWLLSQDLTSMYTWVLEDNPSRRFYESLGGIEFTRQTIAIGSRDVVEVAYGWDDISPLATTSSQ